MSEQTMSSSRPYILRAMYEWVCDNNCTALLVVDANCADAQLPNQYVEDGRIVLNISPSAVKDLQLGEDYIFFDARFAGQPMAVSFPVSAVLAIYARENGQGMVFEPDAESPEDPDPAPPVPDREGSGPSLKLVK